MYGKRRYSKKSASSRAGGATRMRRNSTYKKVGSTYTKSRSLVGQRLARREIKYDDDYYMLQGWTKTFKDVTSNTPGFTNWVLGGMIKRGPSSTDVTAIVGGNMATGFIPGEEYAPNCLTNIVSGTTANSRIGNLVQPRYLTVKGVVNAAITNSAADAETTFRAESGVDPITLINRYMRTSVRIIILRDKSMNEKGFVEFSDVFERPTTESGNNPYLWNRRIDTIGRYQILKSVEYDLDQDDPQKTFSYTIPLNGIAIRFNGAATPTSYATGSGNLWIGSNGAAIPNTAVTLTMKHSSDVQSMTNGIYLLAVAHCGVTVSSVTERYGSPAMVFSSRLTFED